MNRCLECGAELDTNFSYGSDWVFWWCTYKECSRRYLLTWPEETV